MSHLPAFEASCEKSLRGILLTNMGSGTEKVELSGQHTHPVNRAHKRYFPVQL